ncbi:MAG: acyloxyacyl hydrolase [candidate division NC10 bacterium]|nr:acyloxyacyl hydrolase [candidate division NC10 bacterium]MDE2321120.1 acyloxyacyl hydrolase [candidate division NC10 bacterium]
MINGLRRIPVCFWLAVFAILSPAISWAEASPQAVTLGRETELIAARTLAFADTQDPPAVEKEGIPTLHPEEGFQAGTWHVGAIAGYSTPHNLPSRPTGAPNVHFAPLFLQAGYTVTDVHGPTPIRGSLEAILEPTFLITATPKKTFGEGISILGRYNFVTGTRFVPFFSLGIGLLHWNLEISQPRTLQTHFNFTLQAGTGLHYFVTDHLAVTGEVRLFHISNAHRETPNIGINSTVYVLGASYFF